MNAFNSKHPVRPTLLGVRTGVAASNISEPEADVMELTYDKGVTLPTGPLPKGSCCSSTSTAPR